MKIVLLSIGNKFERFEEDWIGVFEKRLRPYAKLDAIRLKDGPKAWEELEKKIPEKSILTLLDVGGTRHTTESFRAWMDGSLMKSSTLAFAIGGSNGFPSRALERADHRLSLSGLTFAHKIAHLVFVEQLYRVMCLRAGHPYHHAG